MALPNYIYIRWRELSQANSKVSEKASKFYSEKAPLYIETDTDVCVYVYICNFIIITVVCMVWGLGHICNCVESRGQSEVDALFPSLCGSGHWTQVTGLVWQQFCSTSVYTTINIISSIHPSSSLISPYLPAVHGLQLLHFLNQLSTNNF